MAYKITDDCIGCGEPDRGWLVWVGNSEVVANTQEEVIDMPFGDGTGLRGMGRGRGRGIFRRGFNQLAIYPRW
jgi:hypothetical protein